MRKAWKKIPREIDAGKEEQLRREPLEKGDVPAMLLAAFDGMLGGTMYTIQYAMKRKLEVVLLDVTPT